MNVYLISTVKLNLVKLVGPARNPTFSRNMLGNTLS